MLALILLRSSVHFHSALVSLVDQYALKVTIGYIMK
jgi:hypothetical protein